MEIGIEELRASLCNYKNAGVGESKPTDPRGRRRRSECVGTAVARRVSLAPPSFIMEDDVTALFPPSSCASVVTDEMDLRFTLETPATRRLKQGLLAGLGMPHSEGSQRAQQRVSRAVLEARRRAKEESAEIDAAIAARRAHERRLHRQAAEETKALRRALSSRHASQRRPSTGHGTSTSTLSAVNWSLSHEVPLLMLPQHAE